MDPTRALATDARSLDRLKLEASRDPQAAVRQAATQFESLFMQMVLKSMRDAMPKSGMTGGSAHDMYTGMLDQQLSQSLSGRPGGLADVIARQLSRNMPGAAKPEISAAGFDPAAAAGQARLAAALRQAAGASASPAGAPSVEAKTVDVTGLAGKAGPDLSRLSPRQAEFVARIWPHAQLAEQQTGVPAAFVAGQAALESGWGKGEIRMPDGSHSHNVFGIKASANWKGATVDVTTTEYVDGKPRKQVERFRAYGSYAEAFSDWASLMGSQARYGQVLRASSTVQGYAQGMQRAGYATDPAYGAKLERTINQTLAIKRLVV